MAKQTLKHEVNGEIFTRTTARNYTHVCVARVDKGRTLASAKAELARVTSQSHRDAVTKEQTYKFKYRKYLLTKKVGEKAFYDRNQGGFYLNRTGEHMEVRQYMLDLAAEYLGESIEANVENELNECRARAETWISHVEKSQPVWEVYSWHGSATLARKAADALYNQNREVRVEAINNGAA